MPKFRKKPVVIEAWQYDGMNGRIIESWSGGIVIPLSGGRRGLTIKTLEGTMFAGVDDWIIKGIQGEFYPCKPDIFSATYEAVDAS